uniref:Aminotransferase class I/classII large domain-containing protein n=1 Tax=Glossina brevipalpis TaxID=37001 RepID=A0A1A9WBP6_9MUSC
MTPCRKEHHLKHLFDGKGWDVYNSDVVNLSIGAPGTDLLENCCEIFQKATEHRLKIEKERNCSLLFQYGPTSGNYEARSAIAKYFGEMYKSVVNCEDIFITSGATQGLHMVLSTLIDLNGYVFVDEVTYMIGLDVIRQFHNLKIIPVCLNDDGVDLQQLEHFVKANHFKSKNKEFWALYYTTPTFHNPTGILFSDSVCQNLIKLARKYDFLITCDDVYNILHYNDDDDEPPKRLFAYDDCNDKDYKGHVLSNGSFSKIIGPGIRLGWIEAPPRIKTLLDNSGVASSGGCLNNYTSCIVASLFELNLAQKHICYLYETYKERMLAACEILKANLPKDCNMLEPKGGYFIWIRLPERRNAAEFLEMCIKEEKIVFIAGPRFAVASGQAVNCLRLAIAFHTKERIKDAALRICQALKRFLDK